jgi:GWxTD domain-containing protein
MATRWLAALCGLVLAPSIAVSATIGSGDFEFFLDAAAFRADDGSSVQEVYLHVPNSEVRFKEMADGYQGKVRLTIEVQNAEGKDVASDHEDLTFTALAKNQLSTPLYFQSLTKRFPLAPGDYRLMCKLEDLNSPKVTILGMVRGEYKSSTITGYPLEVPDYHVENVAFSDAEFLWSAVRKVYHPNPSRVYGLYRDSLRVYVEAYTSKDIAQTSGLRIATTILDDNGEVVKEVEVPLPPQTNRPAAADSVVALPLLITQDLNRFPAGRYSLYIDAGLPDRLLARTKAGNFSVAWDLRTWEVSRRTYLAEARFLLADEDFAAFEKLSIGEQEAELRVMWKKLDPDPTTGTNEAYNEFMARLEYVNARFDDSETGIFSDRALIYLKYGPPDEMIVDVIPLNRESISDALEKVEDKFHVINFSTSGNRIGYAQPSRSIIVDPRRLGSVGEGGEVAYPYELWVYNENGKPILERDKGLEPDIGIRFIFIDREGYGRYKLESSSSLANK